MSDRTETIVERLDRWRQMDAWIFSTMLVSACLSLLASFVLSANAVKLAANPDYPLPCNINDVVSCTTVARSWQAELFGFPNAFLGLVAEPVVITIAIACLAKVKFPRGIMFAAQVVYTIGVCFAYWLYYQAAFVIKALCPWCLLVTLSTTLVFASLTHVNIRDSNLFLPPKLEKVAQAGLRIGLDLLVVILVLAAVATIAMAKYGSGLIQ